MNKKFNELPKSDRLTVINAAIDVFSQLDFESASTDLIANKAQISHESLLDYFNSKTELYLFLYKYCTDIVYMQIKEQELKQITDFFQLLRHMLCYEYQLPKEIPFFRVFVLQCLTADKDSVSEEIEAIVSDSEKVMFEQSFGHIDTQNLQDGVDCFSIVKMILCMTYSYVHNSNLQNRELSTEKLGAQFDRWVDALRAVVYK